MSFITNSLYSMYLIPPGGEFEFGMDCLMSAASLAIIGRIYYVPNPLKLAPIMPALILSYRRISYEINKTAIKILSQIPNYENLDKKEALKKVLFKILNEHEHLVSNSITFGEQIITLNLAFKISNLILSLDN